MLCSFFLVSHVGFILTCLYLHLHFRQDELHTRQHCGSFLRACTHCTSNGFMWHGWIVKSRIGIKFGLGLWVPGEHIIMQNGYLSIRMYCNLCYQYCLSCGSLTSTLHLSYPRRQWLRFWLMRLQDDAVAVVGQWCSAGGRGTCVLDPALVVGETVVAVMAYAVPC